MLQRREQDGGLAVASEKPNKLIFLSLISGGALSQPNIISDMNISYLEFFICQLKAQMFHPIKENALLKIIKNKI